MEISRISTRRERGLGLWLELAQTARMAGSDLQKQWQQHQWQHSPFAPTLRILQAMVGGKTASGAGFSRYDALMRCLGETAEIMALHKGERSDGLAAGPDIGFASTQAVAEKLERWALWEWWHGRLKAQPLAAGTLIATLRQATTDIRQTALWHLPAFPHIKVAIAKSQSPAGTQPVLGFGANICPLKAAKSALIELGLMELNLLTPSAGLQAYFVRVAQNPHCLFPDTARHAPKAASPQPALLARLASDNIQYSLHNRTPAGSELMVIKAEIPAAPQWGAHSGPLL